MTTLIDDRRYGIDGELRRFSRDEYQKMGEIGLLGEGDELIDGVVVIRGTEKSWHWTCDDYDLMYHAGIIGPDERVELIDGEVITLAPMGPGHRTAVSRLNRLLIKLEDAYGSGFSIIPESPIRVGGNLKPQADIAVVAGSFDDLEDRDIMPSDVRLLIEVSESTLRSDRKKKYRHYAEVGIREYWIINVAAGRIEVYREPSGSGYGVALTFGPGDIITPLFSPNVSIAVSDVLPRGKKS